MNNPFDILGKLIIIFSLSYIGVLVFLILISYWDDICNGVLKLLVGKNNEIILSDLKELPSSTAQELEDMGIKIMITLNQCE